MNGYTFTLSIALLLVEHTSITRLEASAHVEASGMGRTAFAGLGDDVMEELARDFERELDVLADELQTVPSVEATASPADVCSSGQDLRRALDDQELRALFEELESSGDAEGAIATVVATAPTKSSIDPAARGRGRSNAGTRGHQKRRKRRRRTPRRTPSVSNTTIGLAHQRRDAESRSAAEACQSAMLLHRSRAASESVPCSVVGSFGAKSTARKVATAITDTAAGPRRTATHRKAGGNAVSASAVQQQQRQQQQQRIRYGGVDDHRGGRGFGVAAAASSSTAAAVAVGMGDPPKWGSEGLPLRRLLGVLITAAIVAALSTAVPRRLWPRPLVFVAVPLVHALVAWIANAVRSSSRGRKEQLMGATKITVVLVSVIGVYLLTMALTQPLSRLREKDH